MFFVGRTGDRAGFRSWIGQTQFGCDDGELGCAGRVSLEHHVPNAGVKETGKRITAFACDHYKPLWLLPARSEAVELGSIDHDDPVDAQVGLVHQEYPVCTVA
jgi:hypothetical protein